MRDDPIRDEAEQLVSAAIAAVSMAARGLGLTGNRGAFATGSPECCVCPVCRVIAAMRDPHNDLTEKVSAGAGDLATAVAGLLRTLAGAAAGAAERSHDGGDDHDDATREGDEFWEQLRRRAQAGPTSTGTDRSGRGARREGQADRLGDGDPVGGRESGDDEDGEGWGDSDADPWHVATTGRTAPAVAPTPMARKAVAKKAVAKKAVARKAGTAKAGESGAHTDTTGAAGAGSAKAGTPGAAPGDAQRSGARPAAATRAGARNATGPTGDRSTGEESA